MGEFLAIIACVWVGCGVLAGITDRDYGRAACLGRDINEWAVMLFVAPLLLVCAAPFVLWRLVSAPFTRAHPSHQAASAAATNKTSSTKEDE